jgi:hypothetical protein
MKEKTMLDAFFLRKIAPLLSLIVVLSMSGTLLAQTKPQRTDIGGEPPKSILWIGNSFFYYNNSMHNYVSNLMRAADLGTK